MAHEPAPLINCVMLVTWPRRREMIHEAIASFACQDYEHRTLTVVNDGEPCHLSAAFSALFDGRIIQMPSRTSVGEKRNQGVAAVPGASYSASFDDDDFSLPHRLSANLQAMQCASACWLSASRKFIAIGSIDNIVGFECGRCYGAGMVAASVTRQLRWPSIDCFEDQRLFEFLRDHVRRRSVTAPVLIARGKRPLNKDWPHAGHGLSSCSDPPNAPPPLSDNQPPPPDPPLYFVGRIRVAACGRRCSRLCAPQARGKRVRTVPQGLVARRHATAAGGRRRHGRPRECAASHHILCCREICGRR